MNTTHLVGLSLASVYGAVVAWVVWAILFNREPAWPQYWSLAAISSMPASLVVFAVSRVACKAFYPRRKQFTVAELEQQVEEPQQAAQAHPERAPVVATGSFAEREADIPWERVRDFANFQLPFLLFGVGGVLWWYFVPQWLAAAYHAVL